MKVQIQFGTYAFGDRLPTMDETSRWFQVSIDTVRAAYLQLKQEGYITLTQNIGATVCVQYTPLDIERNIQDFFTERKDTLIDLSYSMKPLFANAQWEGLKGVGEEALDEIEQLARKTDILPVYSMCQHLQLIYGSLGNDLLMSLVWQTFMFFQAPYLSIPENVAQLNENDNPLLKMVDLCRKKDWNAVRSAIEAFQDQLTSSLRNFLEKRMIRKTHHRQISFSWELYKKSSQICYTLGMEYLIDISRGMYPAGSILPSLECLAKEKRVSVSTVRRTFSLLKSMGIVRTLNGIGTQVLPIDEYSNIESVDFSNTTIQSRLMDFVQALHLLEISCADIVQITLPAMNLTGNGKLLDGLRELLNQRRNELVTYTVLEYLAISAPYGTVRTVYTQLLHQLFWGHPLRWAHGVGEGINTIYRPYIDTMIDCIVSSDIEGFARELKELLHYETDFAARQLLKLGIKDMERLVQLES